MAIKKLTDLGNKIFMQRYAYPGDKDYADRCKAIARHMASAENDDDKEKWEQKFYEVLSSGDFVPGGRIIFGSGRGRQNLLNCYVLNPEDNVDSIGKVISDMYKISCGGGGVGFNFSNIRPRGDDIQNIKNSAPGSVSVMKMINEIGNHVRAGKNRRTALIAILNVTHPDILEFLNSKLSLGELTNFNISVGITDRFIEACENNEEWYFFFNNKKYYLYDIIRASPIDGTQTTITVVAQSIEAAVDIAKNHFLNHPDDIFKPIGKVTFMAMDLWNMLWENAVKSGDPGIFNIDLANKYTNAGYFERLDTTNPSLRGDTLVHTKYGALPIKYIAENCPEQEFYTFENTWKPGYCKLSGQNKQLYKITFNNGKEIFCTPEHKWPLLKENNNYKRDNKQKIDYTVFNKVETINLKHGDKIYLPKNLEINNINDTKTRDDGFCLGWNLGDGWRSWHKLHNKFVYGFIFSKEDHFYGISDFIKEKLNSKFNKNNSLRENKGCFELYYGNKESENWFELLGHKGKESGIPLSVWTSNKEFISGFVDGLFSSDGYVSKNDDRIQLTTVHKNIAIDIQKLLLMFGISSYINESVSTNTFSIGPSSGKDYTRFDVYITGIMAKRFAEKFLLTNARKQANLNRILDEFESNLVTSKEYLYIESVEKTDIYEDVYDITVYDNTHTFAMESGITGNCGEIPLPSYGNCCLGNINLSNMVLEDGSGIDWKRLAATIRAGVRLLDNVLTVNHYPIEECKTIGQQSRRIGLGVLGLHYALIKLGLKYGSDKCIEFLERLFSTIRDEAYIYSCYLSRDKGPFPKFEYKKYLEQEFAKSLSPRIRFLIKEHGIRNAVLLTVPPTGTISMVHGVSSGIEPIFSAMYKRRYREGNTWRETIVLDPLFKEYMEKGKDLSLFVGAYDVTPEEHMKVQAAVQRFIDSAVSKTINLPNDAKAESFNITALKYAPYLKGLTIYRAGSKGMEPLEAIPLTEENIRNYALPLLNTAIDQSVESGAVCKIGDGSCGS